MRWQWALLLEQSGPPGLAREGLFARHGCLVRSLSYLSRLVCWSVWSVTKRKWVCQVPRSLCGIGRVPPKLKYQQKYHADLYQPLSEWPIPVIDRDTDPYRLLSSTKFTDMPTLQREAASGRHTCRPRCPITPCEDADSSACRRLPRRGAQGTGLLSSPLC